MPSSDTYMELSDPSVWGETYDSQFGMGPEGRRLGAFEVATFKFGVSAAADDDAAKGGTPGGAASGGRAGAASGGRATAPSGGRTTAAIKEPTLQNITISKFIDKASPDLFLACCKKRRSSPGTMTD